MSHLIIPTDMLAPDEQAQLILRRHPIVLIFLGVMSIGLCAIGIVTLLFQGTLLTIIGEKIFWMLFSLYSIFSLLFLVILWINTELDFLVFTNQRLISISQKSLLSREVVTLSLGDIQEVRSSISGILPTVF